MNTMPGSRQTSLSRARHTLKYKLFTSPHPLFAQIEPFAASAVVAQMPQGRYQMLMPVCFQCG